MNVILYMAITPNGYIAKEDDDTDWISQVEWESYSSMVRNTGCMIVGHRTYNILTKQDGFEELENVKIVIVSHQTFSTLSPIHIIAKNPHDALTKLSEFEQVIVAGGGILNTSFLNANLVNEIYLDIEPIIFGKGLRLFAPEDFEKKLSLLETKLISKDLIQLHYKVSE